MGSPASCVWRGGVSLAADWGAVPGLVCLDKRARAHGIIGLFLHSNESLPAFATASGGAECGAVRMKQTGQSFMAVLEFKVRAFGFSVSTLCSLLLRTTELEHFGRGTSWKETARER